MFLEIGVLLALIILLRVFVFKTRAERMYEKFPGPKCYPIIGSVLEFDYPRVEISETLKSLAFKYGSVYFLKIGLEPVVCLSDYADVEVILGSTTELDKAPLYWPLHQWLKQGLLTSKAKKWRRQRKIITPAFHFKILEGFVPIFVKTARILVDKFSNVTEQDIDITQDIDLCMLDNIVESAMGIKINAQKEESKYVSSINELLSIIANRNFKVMQRTPLFHLLPIGRRHDKLISYLHGFTKNVMKERKTKILERSNTEKDMNPEHKEIGIKEKKAFLDLLLEASLGGTGLTDSEISEEVDTFMFEGYDTTGTTTANLLYHLSQNQDVQNKAYEEIYSIFGDSDREPTYEELKQMQYLRKVLLESLRIGATIPFIARQVNNDLQLRSGYTVPAKTSIIILIEAMNLNPSVYPDPYRFDPHRFDKRPDNPYSFIPFSAGPRNCIGQKFAVMEVLTVVSLMLRKFRLLPSNVQIKPMFSVVLKSTTGFHLKLEHR